MTTLPNARPSALRERYLSDSVSTISPVRLLVMLYDRLVLDLRQAETAMTMGNHADASTNLLHAQDIVMELRASLRMDVWDGAVGLAKIYGFLFGELISANVTHDAAKVTSCRELVEPLADAWRQAALITATAAAA